MHAPDQSATVSRSTSGRRISSGGSGRALDEPRDEVALRLDERDHLRPDPERGSDARRLVLGPPVDPEQMRVLPADAQHVGAAVALDPEVAIRDPAAERLDLDPAPGPDACGDPLDVHERRS